MKRLVIIDGHNLLFRMFYGIPASIKNHKGIEIRGVYGFIGAIKRIARELEPYSIIVIFDSETSKLANVSLLDTYKGNRPDYSLIPEEENPFSSLPIIKSCLDYLGIFHHEVIDHEADDYIASITHNMYQEFSSIIVVSNDSDFFSLIDDKVFIYSMRGKDHTLYDCKTFYDKFHIAPEFYVIYKSLVGDTSDNIPGVKGIGKVTASKLLSSSSIEEFLHEEKNNRILTTLKEHEALITRNISLITLAKNLDTTFVKIAPLSKNIADIKVRDILNEIDEF